MIRNLNKQSSSKQKTATKEAVAETTFKPGILDKPRIQFWFIVLFSFAIYANTLFLDYALDDSLMITMNSFTKKGFSGFKEIMTNDAFVGFFGVQKKLVSGGRYRPLSQLFFAAEYSIFGLKPFWGHLINVLFYAFVCGFLFVLLRKLMISEKQTGWFQNIPFIATALFAAHPLHTEVVANIKGRDEILSILLSVSTIFFCLKYIDSRKIWALALSFVFFLLGLLAKENTITTLAVVPLVLYFFRKPKIADYFISLIPLLVATGIYFVIRQNALGYLTDTAKITELLNDPYVNSSTAEKLATNTYTWGLYLKLLLIPHPLTHDYYPKQIPLIGWNDPRAFLSLLAYIALGILALIKLKKKHILSFAILFFFITFSISSNIVFNIGTFMNERFMFLPLLGFTIAIAGLAVSGFDKKGRDFSSWRKYLTTGFIIIMALYSVKTFSRNFTWKDDFTLFTTDAETSMNSAKCNVSAGGKCSEKALTIKDPAKKAELLNRAEKYLRKGIDIYPNYAAAWVLLGNVYYERKDYKPAVEYYFNCLKIFPTQAEALAKLNLAGIMLGKQDDFQTAISAFQELIRLQPGKDEYIIQLADQYSHVGKQDSSLIMLNEILARKPDNSDCYSKLGEIYGRVYNNMPLAEENLLKANKLDPKNASTLENLGIVNGIKRNFPASINYFRRALEHDSVNTRILLNLSSTYNMMGQMKSSDSIKQVVQKIKAENPDAN
jgi:tetratricopeptide (TPR) repeat protein